MLKLIGLAVALLIGGVLLVAAMRPDSFRVQRSASIQAPPEKIFPLINDLKRFKAWSPFDKKDPNLKRSYSGAASGKRAAFAFEGNKDVGRGRSSSRSGPRGRQRGSPGLCRDRCLSLPKYSASSATRMA